jgi:hypothetical protein
MVAMGCPTSERYGYVLTVEERYWNRFCSLNRTGKAQQAYVSSGDILRDPVKLIFFYSVRPYSEILGYADLIERKSDEPAKLWTEFGHETCFRSLDEYKKVTRGKPRISFVRFENFHPGSEMVPFEEFSTVLSVERMSQTGMYIDRTQAAKLIELLK